VALPDQSGLKPDRREAGGHRFRESQTTPIPGHACPMYLLTELGASPLRVEIAITVHINDDVLAAIPLTIAISVMEKDSQ